MNTNKILDLLYAIENLSSVMPLESKDTSIQINVKVQDDMYINLIRYRSSAEKFENSVYVYFTTPITNEQRIISLYNNKSDYTMSIYTEAIGYLVFGSDDVCFEYRNDIFDDWMCSIDVRIDDEEFFQYSTLYSREVLQCIDIIRNYKFCNFKSIGIVLYKLIEFSDDEIEKFTKACIDEYKNIKNNHIT